MFYLKFDLKEINTKKVLQQITAAIYLWDIEREDEVRKK